MLAAQLIVEEALEVDSRDALDRDILARSFEPGQCYRNGYRQAEGATPMRYRRSPLVRSRSPTRGEGQ